MTAFLLAVTLAVGADPTPPRLQSVTGKLQQDDLGPYSSAYSVKAASGKTYQLVLLNARLLFELTPYAVKGRPVRLRGYVGERNFKPMFFVTHIVKPPKPKPKLKRL